MYIERTDSTNTLLREMIAKGEWQAGEEYLYTGFQTAGRGQSGNGWESEEGKNLLCSILIDPQKVKDKRPFFLNVAVSVAVHRMVNSQFSILHSQLTIKWPNDIYWKDKKIAGILVENALIGSEVRYSIAGIGLNVNQTEWLSNAPNPVSMRQISGEEYDIHELMKTLMNKMHTVLAMKREEVWTYYRTHLYRKDGFWPFVEREVSIAPTMNANKETEGIFLAKIENIRADGEIELRDQEGNLRLYHFKEVRYVI